MKNSITCKNCGEANSHYNLNCVKCKTYLRERVVNIDFWNFLGKLVESPVSGFNRIIYAENKNFIYLILILFSLKQGILTLILNSALKIELNLEWQTHFFMSIGLSIASVFTISLIITVLNKLFGYISRFKDNLAIIIYSLFPFLVGLILFFPVELVMFGEFLFSFDPSPFYLKPVPAIVISILEALMIIWSIVLIIFAIFAQTKNIFYSVISSIFVILFVNILPIIHLFHFLFR